MIRKVVLGGIAAVALATFASDTGTDPNNCAEYRSSEASEKQVQKFVGGKCFYYFANVYKQELLIYQPQPGYNNLGTLTEILLTRGTNQIEISRHAVNDLRKGPNPDDINYEYIHEIPISAGEKGHLLNLFRRYIREIKTKQRLET